MMEITYQSLKQIGIGLDRMVITRVLPCRCDELYFLDGISQHGTYLSPLTIGALEVLATSVPAGPRRKLLVVRNGARHRRLLNQDEIVRRMAAHGYTVIDPGTMTLAEQISTFAGAERVVGVLGAAMTNIAFCPAGTPVAIITHAYFPDTFFWFIANIKKMPYLEVRCEPEDRENLANWDGDFSIRSQDIDSLTRF
jgi:capsular polysaccharide biosynthesis protein